MWSSKMCIFCTYNLCVRSYVYVFSRHNQLKAIFGTEFRIAKKFKGRAFMCVVYDMQYIVICILCGYLHLFNESSRSSRPCFDRHVHQTDAAKSLKMLKHAMHCNAFRHVFAWTNFTIILIINNNPDLFYYYLIILTYFYLDYFTYSNLPVLVHCSEILNHLRLPEHRMKQSLLPVSLLSDEVTHPELV